MRYSIIELPNGTRAKYDGVSWECDDPAAIPMLDYFTAEASWCINPTKDRAKVVVACVVGAKFVEYWENGKVDYPEQWLRRNPDWMRYLHCISYFRDRIGKRRATYFWSGTTPKSQVEAFVNCRFMDRVEPHDWDAIFEMKD